MSKKKSYFSGLKKSTKITVLSCGCFLILTMAILIFFVLFPITPSEKVIAGLGRESISRSNRQTTVASTTAVTTTAMEDVVVSKAAATTTAATTSHKEFAINVTSGSGFYVSNTIPTGEPYSAGYVPTTETATEYYDETYDDGSGYYDDGSGYYDYNYDYGYDYGYDNSYDNGYYGY